VEIVTTFALPSVFKIRISPSGLGPPDPDRTLGLGNVTVLGPAVASTVTTSVSGGIDTFAVV